MAAFESLQQQCSVPEEYNESARDAFIDALLDIFVERNIFVSYVRFSAVTMREVEAAIEAERKAATAG